MKDEPITQFGPNTFIGSTSWSEICALSRIMAAKSGSILEVFRGIPALEGYRVFAGMKLDLVYAMDSMDHPKVATRVTGEPAHIYDEWHSSGSCYRGWSEDQSNQFTWLSMSQSGASIVANKINGGANWRIICLGASNGSKESSLVAMVLTVHYQELMVHVNQADILGALRPRF